MKNSSLSVFVCALLIFLLFTRPGSARFLATQDEKKVGMTEWMMIHAGSTEGDDALNEQLMGLEKCDEKDEVCLKRRMGVEAHLDYIYTQNHNP